MHVVTRLRAEKAELERQVAEALERVVEMQAYLASSKFQGVDSDWVGVSTDMAPKLMGLRGLLLPGAKSSTRTGGRALDVAA